MMLFPQSSTGMAEEEAEKEISKRKKILRKFLLERGESVKLDDIVPTGSWHLGEFNVGKRIYHVDDIREIVYGDDWFKYHEYKDYGKFRVSISYHLFGLSLCFVDYIEVHYSLVGYFPLHLIVDYILLLHLMVVVFACDFLEA